MAKILRKLFQNLIAVFLIVLFFAIFSSLSQNNINKYQNKNYFLNNINEDYLSGILVDLQLYTRKDGIKINTILDERKTLTSLAKVVENSLDKAVSKAVNNIA